MSPEYPQQQDSQPQEEPQPTPDPSEEHNQTGDLSHNDLLRAGLSEDQIKQLSDSDLARIAKTIDPHNAGDVSDEELAHITNLILKEKALDRIRGHTLLTDENRRQLPALYSNEELGLEALAQVKFFAPDSSWYWFGSEYDGGDTMFGLVIGHEIELGYWSMSELGTVRGPMRLPIERDLDFEPKPLREIKAWYEAQRRR